MKLKYQLMLLVSLIVFTFSTVWIVLEAQSIRDYYLLQKELVETVRVQQGHAMGAGVIVSRRGHILSCAHIFGHYKPQVHKEPFTNITVTFYDKTEVGATLVRLDPQRDLALLYLDRGYGGFKYAIIAKVDATLGNFVRVIGHPYDLDWTVTEGKVSGTNRKVENEIITQTNAVINPGNSGGPVFDSSGRVVGLAESLFPYPMFTGQGFFIPSSRIRKFLKETEVNQ